MENSSAEREREKFAICILYGTEFRLKQLCFYGVCADGHVWVYAIFFPLYRYDFFDLYIYM